jgi:hypothetical protein
MTASKGTMWNDVDSIPDPDYRKLDDQMEMRCKAIR